MLLFHVIDWLDFGYFSFLFSILYMRITVMLCDVFLFFPALLFLVRSLYPNDSSKQVRFSVT